MIRLLSFTILIFYSSVNLSGQIYKWHQNKCLVIKDGLFGLIDTSDNIVLPVKYKRISSSFNKLYILAQEKTGSWGVYDHKGQTVLSPVYKFYTFDLLNDKLFASKNSQSIILDFSNLSVVLTLDSAIKFVGTSMPYEQDLQILKKHNKYGLMNSSGELIIPFIYDEIQTSDISRYFIFKENGKYGLVTHKGEVVTKPIYDLIMPNKEHARLRRKGYPDEIFSYRWVD